MSREVNKQRKKGRPKKNINEKAKPNDKIICNICGGSYTRSNITKHKNTQKHQIFETMNDKIRRVMLKNDTVKINDDNKIKNSNTKNISNNNQKGGKNETQNVNKENKSNINNNVHKNTNSVLRGTFEERLKAIQNI
uniref:C2H2 zinc finger protein n=1 Tax=Moumouvirus australiensis transpoviron TaxID=2711276 RepID=A0A2P1EHH1_9VIRU|nr:C2H2 zinc finger protein [Moumouvirus australiensis transpoviron]